MADPRSWAKPGQNGVGSRRGYRQVFTPAVGNGRTVIAVEPVQEMLDQLIRQFPQIDARTGSAQHIPLDDASMDAVVCAQSFHWFSTPEALQEIHRVLKPGGSLGLVWNVRDDKCSLGRRLDPDHEAL